MRIVIWLLGLGAALLTLFLVVTIEHPDAVSTEAVLADSPAGLIGEAVHETNPMSADLVADSVRQKAEEHEETRTSDTNLVVLATVRDEAEERELTELQRGILRDLRKAMLSGLDLKTLLAVITRAKALPGVHGDVLRLPLPIRRAIVTSLSGCGIAGLPEMYEFFDDPEPEIVQAVTQDFERTLMDMSLSDYDRSEVLIQVSQEIEDQQVLGRLLFMVGMSRPSVGVSTILTIMQQGNETAKAMAPSLMQSFTFQEGIDSPQAAEAYLAEHPDPEWADQFFGGMKVFSENIVATETQAEGAQSEGQDSEGQKLVK